MTPRAFILLIVFLLMIGAGYIYMSLSARNENEQQPVFFEPRTHSVKLEARGDSGESGTATLTETEGGLTRVKLSLNGMPENASQPAHIHSGSCASLGPVKYPLTAPLNGESETVVGAQLDSLKGLVVNVHLSAEEARVSVACGSITF